MTGTSAYEIGDTIYRLLPVPDATPGVIVAIRIAQAKAPLGPGPQPETEGGPVVIGYTANFNGRFIQVLETNISGAPPA